MLPAGQCLPASTLLYPPALNIPLYGGHPKSFYPRQETGTLSCPSSRVLLLTIPLPPPSHRWRQPIPVQQRGQGGQAEGDGGFFSSTP